MRGAKARFFLKRPVAYETLIVWNMLRKSWHQRSDPFFALLTRMPERGVALDIGANRGQSALTIAGLRPGWSVFSFEPNSSCALGLGTVQARLGAQLTVLFEGLGAAETMSRFFEPCLYGFPLTTEGSFNRDNLHEAPEERMRTSFGLSPDEFANNYAVREKFFRVSRLDALDLAPDFIKIDTQGFEAECVAGGRATIDRCSPVIVAEKNRVQFDAMFDLMNGLGYGAHRYVRQGNHLAAMDKEACRNLEDIFWLRDTPAHAALTRPAA